MILLLQIIATFEEPEESMDFEDGIKDIAGLIVTKIRDFIQNPGNGELSKPLKIALSIFNSFEKLCRTLFQKEKNFKDKGRPE